MNDKTLRVAKPILIAATLATILWVSAGSLTPPAGPIASTMKDLTTVEPRIPISATTTPGDADSLFKITQPGSYYFTGNITGESGKNGIEIAASGVTLDLMGFNLLGVPGSFDGVIVTVSATDIAVVNGSLRNWGGSGTRFSLAVNSRLTDLRASGNGSVGLTAGGNAVVTGCVASSNGGSGIGASDGSTITNCSASSNAERGIDTGNGCTVTNCSTSLNTLDGIGVSANCTIRGNTCERNGFNGSGAGIRVSSSDNRIEDNNCADNDIGIDVDIAGNFIARNTCSGNTTNNWDVVAGNVCLVVSATASAAILGNSGGVAPGSADPNANFTY